MSRVASARQRSSSRFLARVLPGAKPASLPGFIEPCLATLREKVPAGARYVHELKLDGYRMQAHLRDGRVTLYTRSALDWTARFPTIAADVARLPAGKLVLDGEVISADAKGHPSFSALQDDLKRRHYDRMVYYAFDLLHLDGFDTRAAPLLKRKRVLQSFLGEAGPASPLVIYSGHFEDGADLYARAGRLDLEGVVSKRTDAPYRSGCTEDWIKVKCWKRNRYVVVGFVPGAGGISALRLGRREGRELLYAGKVGTGFDRKSAADVRRQLEPLAVKRSPLTTPIKKPGTIWVEPRFEAEVAYGHITHDGFVRHPSFKRLLARGDD
jgi:bifunctional non-homologous end joining protein LigD